MQERVELAYYLLQWWIETVDVEAEVAWDVELSERNQAGIKSGKPTK